MSPRNTPIVVNIDPKIRYSIYPKKPKCTFEEKIRINVNKKYIQKQIMAYLINRFLYM